MTRGFAANVVDSLRVRKSANLPGLGDESHESGVNQIPGMRKLFERRKSTLD